MINDLRFVKRFQILAALVILVVVGTVFYVFHIRTEKVTEGVVHQQAKALFNQVIMTRRWVTENGGVFVKVRPGVNPHPYLTQLPGLKVTITDQMGQLYTLRNPGLVTREISQVADKSGLFSFHISSLKPINKETNSPDAFEVKALKLFEKGEKEYSSIEHTTKGPIYRYMAPLYYEESCNRCHGHQGYKIGDIRGGISIDIPMTWVNEQLRVSRIYTIGSAVLVLGLLFGILRLISVRFMRSLKQGQDKLLVMAATDGLTGLLNRTTGMTRLEEELSRHRRSRAPLTCLMMDIDHFKSINDTHGHLAGDAVLVSIAQVLKECTRKHDIVCRYGGEEFFILLPEASLVSGVAVAEKIRHMIEELEVNFNGMKLLVTASFGVAHVDGSCDETADSLIYRADAAMYQAKAEGRNRIKTAGQESYTQRPPA